MKTKKIILSILVIIWMTVIFMFSNQNAVTSQNTSDNVSEKIVDTVTEVTNKKITENEKKNIIEDIRFVIRKTAHFTLYCILGILIYLLLNEFNISKKIVISILLCLMYAISDEIHQMFVSDRTAKILDVFIDTAGSFVGIMLCNIIKKLIVAKNKNNVIIGSEI